MKRVLKERVICWVEMPRGVDLGCSLSARLSHSVHRLWELVPGLEAGEMQNNSLESVSLPLCALESGPTVGTWEKRMRKRLETK